MILVQIRWKSTVSLDVILHTQYVHCRQESVRFGRVFHPVVLTAYWTSLTISTIIHGELGNSVSQSLNDNCFKVRRNIANLILQNKIIEVCTSKILMVPSQQKLVMSRSLNSSQNSYVWSWRHPAAAQLNLIQFSAVNHSWKALPRIMYTIHPILYYSNLKFELTEPLQLVIARHLWKRSLSTSITLSSVLENHSALICNQARNGVSHCQIVDLAILVAHEYLT